MSHDPTIFRRVIMTLQIIQGKMPVPKLNKKSIERMGKRKRENGYIFIITRNIQEQEL